MPKPNTRKSFQFNDRIRWNLSRIEHSDGNDHFFLGKCLAFRDRKIDFEWDNFATVKEVQTQNLPGFVTEFDRKNPHRQVHLSHKSRRRRIKNRDLKRRLRTRWGFARNVWRKTIPAMSLLCFSPGRQDIHPETGKAIARIDRLDRKGDAFAARLKGQLLK